MRTQFIAPLAVFVVASLACSVPTTNPFDPDAPPEVQAPAQLKGVVRGVDGPLTGAAVTITGVDGVVTLDDGAWAFELVAGQVVVEITHPAHLRFVTVIELAPGAIKVLDVTLEALPQVPGDDVAHLLGAVKKAGQLSLPAAEQDHSGIVVEVRGTGVRAATNLAGAFDLFLAAGTYDVSFASAGHVELTVEGVVAGVGADTEVPGSPFALQGIPGSVSGVVALEDGALPDGVAIDLGGGGSATTDANGAFVIGDVEAGSWLLTATHPGYEPFFAFGFIEVEPARDTTLPRFTMALSRGAVAGTALLAGESDHSGVVVQLSGGGGVTSTDAEGAFRIEAVREGSYTLRASRDGFVTTNVDGVQVAAGGVTQVDAVTLAAQQGDFSINDGAPFTALPLVSLDLEGDGAVEMRISEDSAFEDAGAGDVDFRAFVSGPGFTLSDGDGDKVIFAQTRNADGVAGPLLSARITLDTTAPTIEALLINGGLAFTNSQTGIVTLSLAASDATSGVTSMQISNDDVFDEPFEPFATSRTHTLGDPTVDGDKSVFVRVRDVAGNTSAPVQATITLDRAPPLVGVAPRIDCDGELGPAFCRAPFVVVHVESADATAMALSNTPGVPNAIFVPFAVDSAHVLVPGDGARAVFVLLRDAAGNVSSALSDDVTIDGAPPTLASVQIQSGAAAVADETVTLTLGALGATGMRVAFDGVLDTEPTIPFATSLVGDLPAGDGPKTVAAVFVDDAGNVSDVVTDTVILDGTAPSAPSVAIDGGAAFSRSVSVTLTLDVVGATQMRVRTDATFDTEPFVPLAQSTVALLPAGDCASLGCKLVCAEFRDDAGNTSTTACDTITLDGTPPAIPVITTLPGVVSAAAFTLALAGEPADAFFAGYEIVVDPGEAGVFSSRAPLPGDPPRFALPLTAPSSTDPALASASNLVRVRAIDQAGNRSVESTIAITVDPIAPATPTPTVLADVVNADTFAVFFDDGNAADDDANFSHYEIAVVSPGRPVASFTPSGLEDGLIFTLEQGNGSGCASPCRNQLRVRARDLAGNTSPFVQIDVDEDSTVPTRPRLTPRGARVSGVEARMRLEETSRDNGADALIYEIVGGDIEAFTEVEAPGPLAAAQSFLFTLDRPDFTHELCVRGRDAAGNVSATDCVAIEQRASIVVSADGVDEDRPAIFGDLVVYSHANDGLIAHELRVGASRVLDPTGRGGRLDGDRDRILAAWVGDRGNGQVAQLAVYPIDALGAAVATIDATNPSTCVKSCGPNVGADVVDVQGDDVVIVGQDGGNTGVFHVTVDQCTNDLTPCFEGPAGAAQRLTSAARNVQLCRGRFETEVRVHEGVVVWCEQNESRVDEVHRVVLPTGPDQIIATNVDAGAQSPHQPVVTSDGIYWASGRDLCRIDREAVVAVPLLGCPAAQRVLTDEIGQLWSGDEDRIGLTTGSNVQFELQDAAFFDRSDGVITRLTNDILDQEDVELWRDRVVYADRERFSNDVVVNELTAGTWLVAEPSIQAAPVTDGRFVVWGDARDGVRFMAYDLETETEFALTSGDEQLAGGDQFLSAGNGVVAYGVTNGGVGISLFVQSLTTGQRTLLAASANAADLETATLNAEASRVAWFDARVGLRTATLSGITLGPITTMGGPLGRVRRMGLAGDTAIFENQQEQSGTEIRCAQVGATTSNLVDLNGRGASAAAVPGLGIVAAWGAGDDIRMCQLSCGATLACDVQVLATAGGGTVELPKVSGSGYITWASNQTGDGFGQIAVYDLVTDVRFRVATDFGVDGDAPVFDPMIAGQRLVWAGFAFGSSDIMTAVLAD